MSRLEQNVAYSLKCILPFVTVGWDPERCTSSRSERLSSLVSEDAGQRELFRSSKVKSYRSTWKALQISLDGSLKLDCGYVVQIVDEINSKIKKPSGEASLSTPSLMEPMLVRLDQSMPRNNDFRVLEEGRNLSSLQVEQKGPIFTSLVCPDLPHLQSQLASHSPL